MRAFFLLLKTELLLSIVYIHVSENHALAESNVSNSPISGRYTTINLSTVYTNENEIDNNRDTSGTPLIVHILPGSLLLTVAIVIVVVWVVFKRKLKHQNEANSQTNTDTSKVSWNAKPMLSEQGTSSSISSIHQNARRKFH